jgi:hypothetical protein
MSDALLTLPPPEVIVRRLRACQAEQAALRKLLRVATKVRSAEEARKLREAVALVLPAEEGGAPDAP